MRRTYLGCLVVLVLGAFPLAPSARAQTISGMNPSGPAVSPYVNLPRFGAPLGVNYYNLVQPQIQFQSAISGLQQNQASLMGAVTTGTDVGYGPVVTGHLAMFGNTSHYFAGRGGAGTPYLAAQYNLQNQRMLYSPTRYLGGMGMGTGLGGMSTGGIGPGGAAGPTTPRR
jgi:hypothetical protein